MCCKKTDLLIVQCIQDIDEDERVDVTGKVQHGFERNKSTLTARSILPSFIGNHLYIWDYAAMAGLDLSAAFDFFSMSKPEWKNDKL